MEEIHRGKSKHKRKHSVGDNDDISTACHESGGDIPKTKKKKMSETVSADPSYPNVESGDVSHIKKEKKILHDKDKTSAVQEAADSTKMTRKKKSKKKANGTENSSLKHGIVETTAQSDGLDSHESKGRQANTAPDERLKIQKGDDAEVKGKKKSKKKSKNKQSPGTSDHGFNETTPKKLQTASPDEESKTGPDKMVKDQEGSKIETTGKKKLKKKKAKDKVKSSLGTVDSELVESTAKSLQINGLDVGNADSSKEADTKKSVSTKKQKKKKKKKTDKKAGKKEDQTSDQNPVRRNDRALNYLHSWNLDKASWKFNKMNQVQLFHMMYDTSLVSDDDFQILLLYLAGLKGQAKEMTHNQAMKLVDGDAENGAEVSKVKEQRAREIVQVLS